MTNKEMLKSKFQITESSFGTLAGGFALLTTQENTQILGGEESNNCRGGNCVDGCGTNLVAGCGANTNTVAGCGTKQAALM